MQVNRFNGKKKVIDDALITIDGRISFSVIETAEMFGVSERSVRTRISNGEVKVFRFGGRILISIFELLRLMDEEVDGDV